MAEVDARPNILLIVSDEERRNDWLDGVVNLPGHERLRGDGLSFDRYFTHASPCSPSRASLYTGRYLAEHGVVDNVAFPTHTALDPDIPTIGSLLAERSYRSSYLGKWHLGHSEAPDTAAHGYHDWEGNSRYAVRGFYGGETKYARYYGVGGSIGRDGTADAQGKLFDVVVEFDDHDHEW